MVSDEDLGKLRQLANEYRISQKSQSDGWPSAHAPTFKLIQDLSKISFQAYRDRIEDHIEEPWRKQNKARVEWLVEQAHQLSTSTANEFSWRMRIENQILERFSVEIACPKCKNRLWRSEIESNNTGSTLTSAKLNQRRLKRKPCTCSIEDRPQDRYEMGTNKLFEDRIDEVVLHSGPLEKILHQKPDRIVGLRETTNIRDALDRPRSSESDSSVLTVRDLVRSSPFKRQTTPVFPFLALEAKSDSAQRSFADILTQTAFPIWSLLNLQKDLQSHLPNHQGRLEPLVWFLGYRGSDWKAYGCYVNDCFQPECAYNIHHLASGDISTKDGALQLLLIVDHIMDWARDTFRPSIIRQLVFLATVIDVDEVSQVPDSAFPSLRGSPPPLRGSIPSKRGSVPSLRDSVPYRVQRTGSTVTEGRFRRFSNDERFNTEDDTNFLFVNLPNTELGAIRLVSNTLFRLTGLRLTEGNVENLLALSDKTIGPDHGGRKPSPCARKLVKEMTRWDEVLLVMGADLDHIEHIWTNNKTAMPEPFEEGPSTEFYVIFEYRCFLNESWDIVRELSYFAISRSAFDMLVTWAAYRTKLPQLESFQEKLRPCSSTVINDAIDCLRSGSQWQVLHSAISSMLLSLYPEPERRRSGTSPAVRYLEFGYPRSPRVGVSVDTFMKMAEEPPKLNINPATSTHDQNGSKKQRVDAGEQSLRNRSFERMFQRVTRLLDTSHDPSDCARCRRSGQDLFALKNWDQENLPSPTLYGAILVSSLKDELARSFEFQRQHGLSLFVFESSPWHWSASSFPTVVEDLAQGNAIYHAIRYGPLSAVKWSEPKEVLWNLPFPYRRSTTKQRSDIARWVGELNGQVIPALNMPPRWTHPWVHQQMLLHFLQKNMSYDDALAAMRKFRNEKRQEALAKSLNSSEGLPRSVNADCVRLEDFWSTFKPDQELPRGHSQWLPSPLRLRGD